MRIELYPGTEGVDIHGRREELAAFAEVVEAGGRLALTTREPDTQAPLLTAVDVRDSDHPGVVVTVTVGDRALMMSGPAQARAILADNLRGMAEAEQGGHLHIEYFPDHPYLAPGSVPIVVNSPHGGMP